MSDQPKRGMTLEENQPDYEDLSKQPKTLTRSRHIDNVFYVAGRAPKEEKSEYDIMFVTVSVEEEEATTHSVSTFGFRVPQPAEYLKGANGIIKDVALMSGIDFENCYYTAICKWLLPRSQRARPSKKILKWGMKIVEDEIARVKPKILVCLGKPVFDLLGGQKISFKDAHGCWFWNEQYQAHVYVMHAPYTLVGNPEHYETFRIDFREIARRRDLLEAGDKITGDDVNYQVIRSECDLLDWLGHIEELAAGDWPGLRDDDGNPLLSVDCEWHGKTHIDGQLRTIQFAWSETEAVVIEFRDEKNEWSFDLDIAPPRPEFEETTWVEKDAVVIEYRDTKNEEGLAIANPSALCRVTYTDDGPGEEDGPWAEGWEERSAACHNDLIALDKEISKKPHLLLSGGVDASKATTTMGMTGESLVTFGFGDLTGANLNGDAFAPEAAVKMRQQLQGLVGSKINDETKGDLGRIMGEFVDASGHWEVAAVEGDYPDQIKVSAKWLDQPMGTGGPATMPIIKLKDAGPTLSAKELCGSLLDEISKAPQDAIDRAARAASEATKARMGIADAQTEEWRVEIDRRKYAAVGKPIAAALARINVRFIGHHFAADAPWMNHWLGIETYEKCALDTEFAQQTVDESSELGLERGIAMKYTSLGRYDQALVMWKRENKALCEGGYGYIPSSILHPYGARDVITPYRAYPLIRRQLIAQRLWDYYKDLFNPFVTDVFTEFAMTGLPMDIPMMDDLRHLFTWAKERLTKALQIRIANEANQKFKSMVIREFGLTALRGIWSAIDEMNEEVLKVELKTLLAAQDRMKDVNQWNSRIHHLVESPRFNLLSAPQLAMWLFEFEGLEPIKSTNQKAKGLPSMAWEKVLELPPERQALYKPAVDKQTLAILSDQLPAINELLDLNAVGSISKSFLNEPDVYIDDETGEEVTEENGMHAWLNSDGRIHSQTSTTDTSRPRTWRPNVLNYPSVVNKRIAKSVARCIKQAHEEGDLPENLYRWVGVAGEDLPSIRSCIKAPEGMVFVESDYATAEMVA